MSTDSDNKDCRVYLAGRLGTHDVIAMLSTLYPAEHLPVTEMPSLNAKYGDTETANVDMCSVNHDEANAKLVIMAVDVGYDKPAVEPAKLPDTPRNTFMPEREKALLELSNVHGSYAVVIGPACSQDVLRTLWSRFGGVFLVDSQDAKPEVSTTGKPWTSRDRGKAVVDEMRTYVNDLLKKYKITDSERSAALDAATTAVCASIEHGTKDIVQPVIKRDRAPHI